jgi:response regulator RpfG family c-di-GMP phosphodiesterase
LHDIGKLGIPDRILYKPGPLNDEEWCIMRRHPDYAYRMLSHVEYLKPALDIPHFHHERWNGTGYPQGLRKDQIPQEARVFAVIDVWDALRSDRPYRKAWSDDEIRSYIINQEDQLFDPQVVETFCREYSTLDEIAHSSH